MSAPTATPRDIWLASARAKGGHLGDCAACKERPTPSPCPEYDALDAAERAAWDALNAAPSPDAARAGHAGQGGRG